ncbi:heme biosynthesis HemY N-terminal domain-containing protein [Oceanospirillum maris]|jgi:HemY protein|uniref:heme biosynthesis HemY N-terminal domain-containing protein n=1 Tax=Oceanospirillum maris TaxID=64977 RepID=UPI00040941B2|nr:heme biosynthesis HemY N-terminal domain-containing protein [Oceanospirillum maris]
MKRLYIFAILALAGGMFAGLLMREDPGYILLSWGKTTVEMSFWIGLLLLGALIVGFHILMRLQSGIRQPLKALNIFSSAGRDKRALKATVKGLLLMAEGQWRKAEKLLKRSAPHSGASVINYLAAARAAHAQGRFEQSDQLLKEALESTPSAETAVCLLQIEFQLERGQYEQCLAQLLRLQKKNPRHRWVLKTLLKVYQKLEDWQGLKALYPQLIKHDILTDAEGKQLFVKLHLAMFEQCKKLSQESYLERIQHIWKEMPSELKREESLCEVYARALHDCKADILLERFISERLRHSWQDSLVIIYGLLEKGDVRQQMNQVEQWLKKHDDSAALYLTAGRVALRNQLWGKASDFMEESFSLQPLATTAAELSRLYSAMGRTSNSRTYYRYCLDLAGYHLPNLPLPNNT